MVVFLDVAMRRVRWGGRGTMTGNFTFEAREQEVARIEGRIPVRPLYEKDR